MKNFNQIVFLLSFVMVGTVFSMEEVPRKQGKEFVEVDNNVVIPYIGKDIRYYGEYRAQQRDNNIVSFPVESTDPLPIEHFEHCADKRFFVTSAKTGDTQVLGRALTILDPAIKKLAVVRGKSYGSHRGVTDLDVGVDLYLGFDTDNFKSVGYKGLNKIYTARIMQIETKKQGGCYHIYTSDWRRNYDMPHEVGDLCSHDIALEVKKYFPTIKIQGCNDPLYRDLVTVTLGRRVNDFDFKGQHFNFRENYWTKEENKLKGITYHSAKK